MVKLLWREYRNPEIFKQQLQRDIKIAEQYTHTYTYTHSTEEANQ